MVGMVCVLFASTFTPHAAASTAQPRAASDLLATINAARAGKSLRPLLERTYIDGLAQEHSDDMAGRKHLDHNGYPERFRDIQTDDPDIGSASLCENVAYVWGSAYSSERKAVARLYKLWNTSNEGHHECMFDLDHDGGPPYPSDPRNVAGIAVTKKGTYWWATFDAGYDSTP